MAELFVSPLVEVVFENLSSIIRKEISLVCGADQELKNLSIKLSTIKDFLEREEEMQETVGHENWLNELKLAAYDAGDILDEYAAEALGFKVAGGQVCNFSFFSPCFYINRVLFRRNIGHKIKEIRARLDGKPAFRSEGGPVLEGRLDESSRETGSIVDESTVIGRVADKERIITLLLSSNYNNSSVGDCCVLPIVGLAGLGKTTLAKCVFSDETVDRHFDLRMWVWVSTKFEVKRLIKEIIFKATGGEACDLPDLDGLQHRLKEKLTGKKYLLVLDDVWIEDHDSWEKLSKPLGCGHSESRIIVTTRSLYVSSIVRRIDLIHLKGLSDEDCWKLFARRAFKEGDEGMYPKLKQIGKDIVTKCGGVPLAVQTLGGHMALKREESEWLSAQKNGMLDIPIDKNGILNELRLSYKHLPRHLRRCFSFCSLFPKDSIIDKNKLIRIWMAQGFIQPSKTSMQMEDEGSKYFNSLVQGCFFQKVEKDEYKMNDCFHDLAQFVTGNECCILEDGRSMNVVEKKVIHLAFSEYSEELPYECYWLRTILQFGMKRLNVEECLFVKFKCLRVLDLSNCEITMLPNSIGELKHLRYLDISNNKFNTLPISMCTLWNLQTLNITDCQSLSELPNNMKNMIKLRHLQIDTKNCLSFMPVEIRKLTCLQTLPIFYVGGGGASIWELGYLKNLRGELEIYNLENVENAKAKVLKDKKDLHSLKLSWNGGVDVVSEQHEKVHEGVLKSLKPHTNLKSLYIVGFDGAKFPKWVSDPSFTNLVDVRLESCNSCQHLPPFGQLKLLEVLHIYGAREVKSIDKKFYGVGNEQRFPLLKSLTLRDFPNLDEWSTNDCQGNMCCLTYLEINTCPKLECLPKGLKCLTTLQDLFIRECPLLVQRCGRGGEDWHEISHIPNINIT